MNKARICVIDDEQSMLDVIESFFEVKDIDVLSFSSPKSFLNNLDQQTNIHAYIVDWKLPEISGIELVQKIREKNKQVPIFMLTSNSSKEEIICGIEAGADDYLVKPCNMKELYARINNAISKYKDINAEKQDLKVIQEGNVVMYRGNSVALTSREFAIFNKLRLFKGKSVDRNELLSVLDIEGQMIKRNVDVHVFSLRKKLAEIELNVITVRGVGYKLEAPV